MNGYATNNRTERAGLIALRSRSSLLGGTRRAGEEEVSLLGLRLGQD